MDTAGRETHVFPETRLPDDVKVMIRSLFTPIDIGPQLPTALTATYQHKLLTFGITLGEKVS